MTKLEKWLMGLPSEERLKAAKKLTFLQMSNEQADAPNATVLNNMQAVLFRLKEQEHEEYINHVLTLLTTEGKLIDDFNDFLSLLDRLPASRYPQWIAEESNQWIQPFFNPENLTTINFFNALTQKPIALLRFISKCGLESVLTYIKNPEEQLYRIARLSWDDLPETCLAHVEPHHYLIQLKKFICFKIDLVFTNLDAKSRKELQEDWEKFIPTFKLRTQELCIAHGIDPSLPLSLIADTPELNATYQRVAELNAEKRIAYELDENALYEKESSSKLDYSTVSTEGLENVLNNAGNFQQQLEFIEKLSYESKLVDEPNESRQLLEAQIPNDNPERLKVMIAYFKQFYLSMPKENIGALETRILKCFETQWQQPQLHEIMFKTALESLTLQNNTSFVYYQSIILRLIASFKHEENAMLKTLLETSITPHNLFSQKKISLIDYIHEKSMHLDRAKTIRDLPKILEIILALKAFARSAQANNNLPTIYMWEKLNTRITFELNKLGPRGKVLSENIASQIKIHIDTLKLESAQRSIKFPPAVGATQEAKKISDGTPDFVDFHMATENCHFEDLSPLNDAIKIMLPEESKHLSDQQHITEIHQYIVMQVNLGNALVSAAQRTDKIAMEVLARLLRYFTQITQISPTIKEKAILQNGFAKALALAANHAFLEQYHYLSKERIPYFIFTALLNWIKIHDATNKILFKAVSLFVQRLSFEHYDKIIDLWPDKKTIITLFWHALADPDNLDNTENQKVFLKQCMIKRGLDVIDISIDIHQQLECLGEITQINNPTQLNHIIQHFKVLKQINEEQPDPNFIITLLEALKKQWGLVGIREKNIKTVFIALSALDANQSVQRDYRNHFLKQYCQLIFDNSHYTQDRQTEEILPFIAFCQTALKMSVQEIFYQIIRENQQLFVAQAVFSDLDATQNEYSMDISSEIDTERKTTPPIKIILNALSKNSANQDAFLDYCIEKKGLDFVMPFIDSSQQPTFIQKFSNTSVSRLSINEKMEDPEDVSSISMSSDIKSATMTINENTSTPQDIIAMLADISGSLSQLEFIQKNPHLIDTPEKLTKIIDEFQKYSSRHSSFEITLLDSLKTQWLEPLNEPMFRAAMACLDLKQPLHLKYYERIYLFLLNDCSQPENIINIATEIKIKAKWLFASTTNFKDYLNEKKQDPTIPLSNLMDILVTIKLFNQRDPNNTTENAIDLKSTIEKGLHLYAITETGIQQKSGRRRQDIMAWFQTTIDAHMAPHDISTTSERPPLSIASTEEKISHLSIKALPNLTLFPLPAKGRQSSAGQTSNDNDTPSNRGSTIAYAASTSSVSPSARTESKESLPASPTGKR